MKYAFLLFCIFILLMSGCVDKTEKIDLNIVQEPETIINDSSIKVAIASVVSKDIDPFLEERLRNIFLNMDEDEDGKEYNEQLAQ